jgi:DHA1 family inner membrane transport protein
MIQTTEITRHFKQSLLLPTLLLSFFLSFTVTAFSSTLLVEIAATFNVSIGTASQLALISSIIGLIMGFVMGVLALKFKHKSLLLVGITAFAVGTFGFYLAQSFAMVLLFQFFIGVGTAVISIMTYTLIGELLPAEKRGWAIGLTVAALTAAYIIVAPLSGVISSIAGWRSVLLWFIFPLSIVCLSLALLGIPAKPFQQGSTPKPLYLKALKEVLFNKSAIACVIATALFTSISLVPIYAVSFYRIAFSVSPTIGGVFSAIAAVGAITGGLVGGKLVHRIGRKPLTVIAGLASGTACILFSYMPDISVSVFFWAIGAATGSMAITALFSLILEQIPDSKASMMSINSAFQNIGLIIGILIGEMILNVYSNNFQLLMTIYGGLGASAAPIILLLARDPNEATII